MPETGDVNISIPLKDTIAEQLDYSKSLKAQPLEVAFQPLKERTGVDLLAARGDGDYGGNASEKPPEEVKAYFDPEAKNRKYYSFDWLDKVDGKTYHYLAVEENQVAGNQDLNAIAIFHIAKKEQNMGWVRSKEGKEKINYLYLERLYLINKKTQKAVEVASTWWQLPADVEDPQKGPSERVIGLLPHDWSLGSDKYRTITKRNTILVSDINFQDKQWLFDSAVGDERAPHLSPWFARVLTGVKATQKRRDIHFSYNIVTNLLLNTMTQEEAELASDIITHDESVRQAVENLKKYKDKAVPLEAETDLDKVLVAAIQAQVGSDVIEKTGMLYLIRLKRNALAATFRFLDHLKWQGFDIMGGLSLSQLKEERSRILQFYDDLYKEGMKELKVQATFSSGAKKT